MSLLPGLGSIKIAITYIASLVDNIANNFEAKFGLGLYFTYSNSINAHPIRESTEIISTVIKYGVFSISLKIILEIYKFIITTNINFYVFIIIHTKL